MRPMRFLGNPGNNNARINRPAARSQSSASASHQTLNLEQHHQSIKNNPRFSNTYTNMKREIRLEITHPKTKEQKPIDPKAIEEALQRTENNLKHSIY